MKTKVKRTAKRHVGTRPAVALVTPEWQTTGADYSFITPLHAAGNQYIEQTYESLLVMPQREWQWIILENNGGIVPPAIKADRHVKVYRTSDINGVGALKHRLCGLVKRPFIVELDADDLVTPDCLNELAIGFATSGADFVFSDCAQFKTATWEAKWADYPYSPMCGWQTYEILYNGHKLIAMSAPPVRAHTLRYIYFAPDHVRAWRKDAYDAVGGHNIKMTVGDDHNLMARMYLAGKRFYHIERCLYLYRVHDGNTVKTQNADIQKATNDVYNEFVWAMAEKWSRDNEYLLVDLCGAIDPPDGYIIVDKNAVEGKDRISMVCDLDTDWSCLPDNSVGLLRANDAIEHLRDPIHTMNEAHRVLAPGGFFMISTPSTGGYGSDCDPTHVSRWNKASFRYYTNPNFAKYVWPSGLKKETKFMVSRVQEWFPNDYCKEENLLTVEAHLIALKKGFQPMGLNHWSSW